VILALETGWTPAMLGNLPSRFRAACHWVLYLRAMIGEDGLPQSLTPPPGATPEQRVQLAQAAMQLKTLRHELYPEGD
jgi:hypothetical protein